MTLQHIKGASLHVEAVSGPFLGLAITASVVGVFSSETSVIPDFVIFTLLVGVVCPNCRGHIVPIMGVSTPVAVH